MREGIDGKQLADSFRELDQLARQEYRKPLVDVALDEKMSEEQRLLQLGRLIGVILKQPFATPQDLAEPSHYSRAYRAWKLKGKDDFDTKDARKTWQYEALDAMRTDPGVIESRGGSAPPSVFALAEDAQYERGFFAYLAASCRRYLCRDPQLRKEIEAELKKLKGQNLDLRNVTPEMIVASGGLAIGAALIQAIPVLGFMGAPVIAAVVFILYSIGIDAFCRWADDNDSGGADRER